MGHKPREPHCIVYRYVTRPGPTGAPESRRENLVCQERHAWKFIQDGWTVFLCDSEVMPSVEETPTPGDGADTDTD